MEILRTFYVLPIYISHELKRKKKGSLYIQTFEREPGAVAKLLVLESLSLYPQSVNHLFLLGGSLKIPMADPCISTWKLTRKF